MCGSSKHSEAKACGRIYLLADDQPTVLSLRINGNRLKREGPSDSEAWRALEGALSLAGHHVITPYSR